MDVVAFWKPQLQVSVGLIIATSNDVGLGNEDDDPFVVLSIRC